MALEAEAVGRRGTSDMALSSQVLQDSTDLHLGVGITPSSSSRMQGLCG